jgi:rare lipoprotein A
VPHLYLAVALALCAPPPPAAHHGKASYYQRGARTANGDRFNPNALTCAHRSLPFGTVVRVWCPSTKREVVVTVTDRGPAAWTHRDLDLASGAFARLADLRHGVVTVAWRVLSQPAPGRKSGVAHRHRRRR